MIVAVVVVVAAVALEPAACQVSPIVVQRSLQKRVA